MYYGSMLKEKIARGFSPMDTSHESYSRCYLLNVKSNNIYSIQYWSQYSAA